jgi:hypothetical protein
MGVDARIILLSGNKTRAFLQYDTGRIENYKKIVRGRYRYGKQDDFISLVTQPD